MHYNAVKTNKRAFIKASTFNNIFTLYFLKSPKKGKVRGDKNDKLGGLIGSYVTFFRHYGFA